MARARRLEGVVARGDGLGRKLGFPTANLQGYGRPPARGVWKVRVSGGPFRGRLAVCNVGVRPTVGGRALRVEVHVPRWRGALYGERLTVEFLRRIRAERRFGGVDELKAQIARDVAAVKRAG